MGLRHASEWVASEEERLEHEHCEAEAIVLDGAHESTEALDALQFGGLVLGNADITWEVHRRWTDLEAVTVDKRHGPICVNAHATGVDVANNVPVIVDGGERSRDIAGDTHKEPVRSVRVVPTTRRGVIEDVDVLGPRDTPHEEAAHGAIIGMKCRGWPCRNTQQAISYPACHGTELVFFRLLWRRVIDLRDDVLVNIDIEDGTLAPAREFFGESNAPAVASLERSWERRPAHVTRLDARTSVLSSSVRSFTFGEPRYRARAEDNEARWPVSFVWRNGEKTR